MTLEQNVRETNSVLVAIKDKIVECGVEVAEGTHAREYAPKIGQVYEAGKKSQYDEFWDAYQDNGKLANYELAFAGRGWNDINFKPKYDIILNGTYGGTQMFAASLITDLCGALEAQGIKLDTKGSKNFGQFMQNVVFSVVPPIDFSNATGSTNYAFASDRIVTIQKLIVSENTKWYAQTFGGATALENVIFEGVNAQTGLNLQWSTKLSKASILSVIINLSTATSGLSVTLSKTAVETAFGSTTSAEWTSLIATKSNWTISLV